MSVKDMYVVYFNQQEGNKVFYRMHEDNLEHCDVEHADYYTDEPDQSPGW